LENRSIQEELQKAGVEVDQDAVQEIRQTVKVPLGPEVHLPMGLEQLRDAVVGLTRDPDLRDFKKQVIQAFKHLGLDTKQFFGV
jgi:hypothetical protein